MFTDVLTLRSLVSSRLVCLVVMSIRGKLKEKSSAVDRHRDPLNFLFILTQDEHKFGRSLEDDIYCKYANNKYAGRVEPDYPPIELRKRGERQQRRKKPFSLPGTSMRITTMAQSKNRQSLRAHSSQLNTRTANPSSASTLNGEEALPICRELPSIPSLRSLYALLRH